MCTAMTFTQLSVSQSARNSVAKVLLDGLDAVDFSQRCPFCICIVGQFGMFIGHFDTIVGNSPFEITFNQHVLHYNN